MKNEDVEITEIVLKMGKTKVSMSLEDAKKVFHVLEKLFGVKIEKEYYPVYERPWRWYYRYDYQKPYIYWSTTSIGSTASGNSNHFNDSPKFTLSNNWEVKGNTLTGNVGNLKSLNAL